ncbi:MAG: WYL domain-containing protein [Deltaproteobacteria bacterium]|nr:WYL domain-containing protein [Deltaproteobacteria bacterium]
MARGDQLGRQWRIIQTLISSRKGKSASELAQELECHPRTLDQIKMLHQTKEAFEVPEEFSLEKFMGPSFGVYQGAPVHIKVWFHPDVAGYIKEKIWHESQQIHSQDDGSIIFEAEVAGADEIRFWVMSWGSKAAVLEPESLREEIRAAEESPPYGGRTHERPLQRG